MKLNLLLCISLLFVTSCGSNTRDRENYSDGQTPAGFAPQLESPEKHMGGYGRQECLICHNAVLNIHRRPGANIDVEALNVKIRNGGESTYCLSCHGNNGVP